MPSENTREKYGKYCMETRRCLKHDWAVPLLIWDGRIRELCARIGLREGKSSPVRSSGNRPSHGLPYHGCCRRSVRPNGQPFWIFSWQHPAQNTVPQAHEAAPRRADRNPDQTSLSGQPLRNDLTPVVP
jgi:hypothetical protein